MKTALRATSVSSIGVVLATTAFVHVILPSTDNLGNAWLSLGIKPAPVTNLLLAFHLHACSSKTLICRAVLAKLEIGLDGMGMKLILRTTLLLRQFNATRAASQDDSRRKREKLTGITDEEALSSYGTKKEFYRTCFGSGTRCMVWISRYCHVARRASLVKSTYYTTSTAESRESFRQPTPMRVSILLMMNDE